MAEPHVISNLVKHRAYLAGEIEKTERHLETKRGELATIDAALRLLDASINPTAIKGIQRHYRMPDFKHGEMTRLCVRALRRAEAPVSAGALAQEIAQAKGIEVTAGLLSRVRLTMIRLAGEGRVIRSGAHRARLWALQRV